MPMRTELQVAAVRIRHRPSGLGRVGSWINAALNCPDFLMVALFCTVGLCLTLYFLHYFPDFGAVAEALQTVQ